MKPVSESDVWNAARKNGCEGHHGASFRLGVRWRESLPDGSTGWRKYDPNDKATWPTIGQRIVVCKVYDSGGFPVTEAYPAEFKPGLMNWSLYYWIPAPPHPPQSDDDLAFEQALKELGYDHPMSESKLSELKAIWQHARKPTESKLGTIAQRNAL